MTNHGPNLKPGDKVVWCPMWGKTDKRGAEGTIEEIYWDTYYRYDDPNDGAQYDRGWAAKINPDDPDQDYDLFQQSYTAINRYTDQETTYYQDCDAVTDIKPISACADCPFRMYRAMKLRCPETSPEEYKEKGTGSSRES